MKWSSGIVSNDGGSVDTAAETWCYRNAPIVLQDHVLEYDQLAGYCDEFLDKRAKVLFRPLRSLFPVNFRGCVPQRKQLFRLRCASSLNLGI